MLNDIVKKQFRNIRDAMPCARQLAVFMIPNFSDGKSGKRQQSLNLTCLVSHAKNAPNANKAPSMT